MTPRQQETARLIAACVRQGRKIEGPSLTPAASGAQFNCNRAWEQEQQGQPVIASPPPRTQRYVIHVRPNGLPSRTELRKQNRCVECGNPAQYYGEVGGYGVKCGACNEVANAKRREKSRGIEERAQRCAGKNKAGG